MSFHDREHGDVDLQASVSYWSAGEKWVELTVDVVSAIPAALDADN